MLGLRLDTGLPFADAGASLDQARSGASSGWAWPPAVSTETARRPCPDAARSTPRWCGHRRAARLRPSALRLKSLHRR